MAEIKYEVVKDFGVVCEGDKWDVRAKIIKWGENGNPKFDLRKWNKDNDKMAKGLSIDLEDLGALREFMSSDVLDLYDDPEPDDDYEEDEE